MIGPTVAHDELETYVDEDLKEEIDRIHCTDPWLEKRRMIGFALYLTPTWCPSKAP